MEDCILCLDSFESGQDRIGIFTKEGKELNVSLIISKHFWLRPSSEQNEAQIVCLPCWEAVRQFDQFYQRVATAHKNLNKIKSTADVDPLPHGDLLLKTEEFFDSEVKVEVHDLEFLPEVEVIENLETKLSGRAQRAASRRTRQTREEVSGLNVKSTKRIKREISPSVSSAESEAELPLAVLMQVGGIKTDNPEDATALLSAAAFADGDNSDETKTGIAAVPLRRRRGRPRKVKQEVEDAISTKTPVPEEFTVKAEHSAGDLVSDDTADNYEPPIRLGSGTDDSDSSSSGSSTDSDNSLPDADPPERYAVIPKRIVVKPKKYRKRPKPLIPPRRMTREEIERKNALQAEYDKVIAQFFDKFVCPKCNLLVPNFGDMKRHFRISHNIDPGYMTCCGRKFHLRKALAEHVYVHWNPEHFKCNNCERVFQDSRSLEVHEQTHTQPPTDPKDRKVFQCDKCPKSFTTKAAFEYHSESKHVPKSEFRFSCPECNKKLPTQRKLKDHMKYMHDPESAIICDKCGKQVRSQSNLKKHHQLEHSEVPRPVPVPMQCEICGTWLRHLSGLKQHMKTIHEDTGGEHRCHICNKTSTNARALKRHIYHNHECERKFKCTMCEKAFKRPQDLREHTSTHTGEVLYTCPNCPMTFFSNANMYKHRQRLHRAEWEADRKKPMPPNIMQQAVGATAAMKMQQAVGATSAFFAHKLATQNLQPTNQPTAQVPAQLLTQPQPHMQPI